jgi:alpha-beta hydrolase superfamily lysophospholipase
MTHHEGALTTSAGTSLYYQSWMQDENPKAALLIVHGLAEHSGRYEHFADFFVDRGYTVFALDYLGHGKSDGDRCHIGQFSDYTDCIALLLNRVREECPGAPLFLVGHSMGGLVATRFLIDHQDEFAGSVLSGAAVQAAIEPSAIQRLAVKFFSKVLPKLRVLQLDASEVSRDPAVVDRYRKDPLVFSGKVTARLAEQLFSTMTWIKDKLGDIELPMLILHGSADGLTSPEGSRMLHDNISSGIKKLIIYDGLYHEVYNEPEQEAVMQDVEDWLAPRLEISAHS